MLRFFPRASTLCSLVAPICALPAAVPRAPQAIVAELCAGCHGAVLTGANGPNLLDGLNHHGNDESSVRASIVDGWPANGMPAYGAVLSEPEVSALVAHILDQRKEFAAGRIKAPVPPDSVVVRSEKQTFRLETWVGGLQTVWGFAFLPDGRLVLTEREGNVRIVSADGKLLPEPVRGLPKIFVKQDGGLLDVIAHPRYAENGWIYLAYSEIGDAPNRTMTAVVRGRIRAGAWTDQEDIFRVPLSGYVADDTSHYGCRFLFDDAGHLFITIGERGQVVAAQDLASPLGKIHRVFDDGRIPPDNPFVGRAGALPSIWSYGHRHPQGLKFHPVTGKLWATEHGPRGGDELNRIEPGRNYGWPLISHGRPQFGETIGGTHADGLEQPAAFWPLSVAPNALEFSTGDRYPGWKNHLLMATLVGEHLRRIETDGDRVVHQEILFQRYGRVRDVTTGPDGLIYVALNNPGRIARLIPVE
jgi:glucose/arabinose dehydrogenase